MSACLQCQLTKLAWDTGGIGMASSTPLIFLAKVCGNYTQTMGHLILSFPSLHAVVKVLKIDLVE